MATEQEPEGPEFEEERPPCREVLGDFTTLILYAAGLSLPLVALLIMVETPRYETEFRGQAIVLSWQAKLFLNPAARWLVLLASAAGFGVFHVAWAKRSIRGVAIAAPILFALALALLGVWVSAMHPERSRGPGSSIHGW